MKSIGEGIILILRIVFILSFVAVIVGIWAIENKVIMTVLWVTSLVSFLLFNTVQNHYRQNQNEADK
ncbi:MAG: hypothetical protein UHS49_05185 [Faecalimonas sp.]|nr:hypothetical protein [Faecalimonas sp.]